MFLLASEQGLVDAFRPRDRKGLELPKDFKFPLFVRDYVAWADPSGFRVNLLFAMPKGAPTGISFRRDQRGGDVGVSRMCEWCHATGSAEQIGLLTADLNSKKRVGTSLCLDLGCKQRLEEAANRSGKNVLEETRQLMERLGKFASEALGIDLSGAGR